MVAYCCSPMWFQAPSYIQGTRKQVHTTYSARVGNTSLVKAKAPFAGTCSMEAATSVGRILPSIAWACAMKSRHASSRRVACLTSPALTCVGRARVKYRRGIHVRPPPPPLRTSCWYQRWSRNAHAHAPTDRRPSENHGVGKIRHRVWSAWFGDAGGTRTGKQKHPKIYRGSFSQYTSPARFRTTRDHARGRTELSKEVRPTTESMGSTSHAW